MWSALQQYIWSEMQTFKEEVIFMKMYLNDPKSSDARIGSSLETYSRKMKVFPTGVCPVIVHYTELMAAAYQTCRKCTPCRQGLPDLIALVKTMQ